MHNCPHCSKDAEQLSSRISHLESAKWSYESNKGKNSFARDNKVASSLLSDLLKLKVDLAKDHVMHTLSPKELEKIKEVKVK